MPSPARSASRNGHKPTHDDIAACAFLIWVGEGRPEGRDQAHWYEAEAQLHITRAYDGWIGGGEHSAGHTLAE